MKTYLTWQVAKSADEKTFEEYIPATVPGNVQLDYARAKGVADDWQFADNFHKFDGLEDCYWKYRATLNGLDRERENYFVALGIDYAFDVFLDGEKIYTHEGMFSKTRLSLAKAKEGSVLEVLIYPAPKNPVDDIARLDQSRIPLGRSEADRSVKPAVGYGWDFHPRLIVQGIWDEAYVQSVEKLHIVDVNVDYEIVDIENERGVAEILVSVQKTGGVVERYLYDENGNCVAKSATGRMRATVDLWYPHTVGKQPLYRLEVVLKEKKGGRVLSTVRKTIGFRKVELLMNDGAWEQSEEGGYPLPRAFCPMQLCINGKKVFAKGSNWVNPEVFVGTMAKEDYRAQLQLVKDCNMNLLRTWGGAIVNKEAFFELCDELGIMVWQEFPLACNNYADDKRYLAVLKKEAHAIVRKIKSHPCHVLWCGGNELFNSWSNMTDQRLALRILNEVCLDEDRFTPFLPPSPVYGVKHGPYWFTVQGRDVFHLFNENVATGYTEFGMSCMADYDQLVKFMPTDALQKLENTQAWRDYFAFDAADRTTVWCDYTSVSLYFGEIADLKEYIRHSQFLACAGYTYVFEEGRRQPTCSIVANWCFNEPWYCAANNSLVGYGNVKKPTYDAVKGALAAVTPSLRMPRFDYRKGDTFKGEVHILNDSGKPSGIDRVDVYLNDGRERYLTTLTAKGSAENEYCGDVSFEIDDGLANGKGAVDVHGENKIVAIVLKANGTEKRYPILLWKGEEN